MLQLTHPTLPLICWLCWFCFLFLNRTVNQCRGSGTVSVLWFMNSNIADLSGHSPGPLLLLSGSIILRSRSYRQDCVQGHQLNQAASWLSLKSPVTLQLLQLVRVVCLQGQIWLLAWALPLMHCVSTVLSFIKLICTLLLAANIVSAGNIHSLLLCVCVCVCVCVCLCAHASWENVERETVCLSVGGQVLST